MRAEVEWDDLAVCQVRMKGKGLLQVQARPGSTAGHLLTLAAFGRAERKAGGWLGAGEILDWYAEFKKIDSWALRESIEAYWRDAGRWPRSAESIIEELSRI